MILILSTKEDNQTDEVCAWLNFYKKNFVRINDNIINYNFDIFIKNQLLEPIIKIENKIINFSDFNVVWFRRGYFFANYSDNIEITKLSTTENILSSNKINDLCERDFFSMSKYLYWYLKQNTKCINFVGKYNTNKLIALHLASQIGLKIPNSLVTEEKFIFNEFYKKDNVITKSISDWSNFRTEKYKFNFFTSKVETQNIPNNFFYSLFQQQIEKSFEVRTFVWDNKTYSAAIYAPPENIKAQVDFRSDYDGIKIVPYKLPQDIENKLLKLMASLDLKSGSADFIVDKNLDFYFLEINPVGQFDFIDKACNYNLAKIIAETLINKRKGRPRVKCFEIIE
ncbi:MAG: grasp-with-spasm system ATP-grasp peptide maturase [Prevotellaceae bacterium]|jgi:ATP-GRASP peptide maturase of grasp-with-spasm system|nr:grasp-with-spasm system ATP-grasp peptide maturase [Prevotellaceae bacterium]